MRKNTSKCLHTEWQDTLSSTHIISRSELQMLATDLLDAIAKGKFHLPSLANNQRPRLLNGNDKTCIHLAILKMTGFDLIQKAKDNQGLKLPTPSRQHKKDAQAILAAATLAYITGYKLPLGQNDFFIPAYSEWITLASAQIAHEATLLPSLFDGSYNKAQREHLTKSTVTKPLTIGYEGEETKPSTPPMFEESMPHLNSTLVSVQPH